jgi:hypothetical protein
MTQKEKVLKYLQTGKGLTTMQAINWWGITRLSGRIFEIRADGYNVVSEMKQVKTRDGKKTSVAVYKMGDK